MNTPLPTARVLRSWFTYDKATGVLTWRRAPCERVAAGDVAGTPHSAGYLRVMFQGRNLYVHRIAWCMVTGSWPTQVDHINGQRSDNRFANFRNATHAQNCQNVHVRRPTNSGYPNVYFDKRYGTFRATIAANKRRFWLGTHATAESANAAVVAARAAHQVGSAS